jgi:hypothetical protein
MFLEWCMQALDANVWSKEINPQSPKEFAKWLKINCIKTTNVKLNSDSISNKIGWRIEHVTNV